jgi:hypothetical protein
LILNEFPVVCNTLSGPFYGKKVDINECHNILGHRGSERLEKTLESDYYLISVLLRTIFLKYKD